MASNQACQRPRRRSDALARGGAEYRDLVGGFARATQILGELLDFREPGRNFGAGLTEREIDYLVTEEWAITAEDVLWRRTKCGLRMTLPQREAVEAFMRQGR